MKSTLVSLALTMLCSLYATLAHSWGAEGHRVTALMAEDMLNPKARIQVNQLLDGGALVDAVLFADVYREALKREVPGSDKWHYDNIPVCRALDENYCQDNNCASAQIPLQFAVLADKTKPKEARALALKFLIHIVGDIHQPLHAGGDDDLGGNLKIIFMPNGTVPRNLHAAWDVDMVKLLLRSNTEADFAKALIKQHQKDFARWMRGSPVSWVLDSHGIAKRLAYGKLPGFTCGEATVNSKQNGRFDGKPWREDTVVMLTEEYVTGATGITPILLARAGARIAGLLNAALDPEGAITAKLADKKSSASPPALQAPPPSAANKPVISELPKTESLIEAMSRSPRQIEQAAPEAPIKSTKPVKPGQ